MSLKSKKKNIIIDDTDNANNVSVDKVKELKNKANSLIENLKKL